MIFDEIRAGRAQNSCTSPPTSSSPSYAYLGPEAAEEEMRRVGRED
jgi:hypothetical protein